jgi:regulator of sirC expression with transglutaminase-like and TPR domain
MSPKYKDSFHVLVNRSDDQIDLFQAALLIAADEYPELNIAQYLTQMDAWADNIRHSLPKNAQPETRLQFLNDYLFGNLGFSGNTDDYYDPRNSYLNEVIDRRRGIPITLSVLYLELGRRLGLNLSGVSFPGHFLVKLPYGGGALVLDPFNGGIALNSQDLLARLQSMFEVDVDDLTPFLSSASNKLILVRLLSNLKGIYHHQKKGAKTLEMINKILLLAPQRHMEYRDRGLLLQSLECYNAALQDFRAYLKLNPEAEDREAIRARIIDLQKAHNHLN